MGVPGTTKLGASEPWLPWHCHGVTREVGYPGGWGGWRMGSPGGLECPSRGRHPRGWGVLGDCGALGGILWVIGCPEGDRGTLGWWLGHSTEWGACQ